MSLQLTLLGPTKSRTIDIEWLEIQSHEGNMVLLEGHAPAHILIKPDTPAQWKLTSGTVERTDIKHGFLEVRRDRALLIV